MMTLKSQFSGIIFFLLFFSFNASAQPQEVDLSSGDLVDKVHDVSVIVDQFYVHPVTQTALTDVAIRGLVNALDKNSEYLTSFEYSQLEIEATGDFVGIGIALMVTDDYPEIVRIFNRSPAKSVGLKEGDKILTIDDKDVGDLSLRQVVGLLQGPADTITRLEIERRGQSEDEWSVHLFGVQRRHILRPSIGVTSTSDKKVGYIQCLDFSDNSALEIEGMMSQMISYGAESFVIDLRDNAGGVFEAGIEVAELFLKKGSLVVSTQGKVEGENQVFRASQDGPFVGYPLILLINDKSASAAEVFAAAIQGNDRGSLLGEKTYGKASIQTVFPMTDGSALLLTTAYYYTPDNIMIHHNGLKPDIPVKEDSVTIKAASDLKKDPYFKTAIQVLDESEGANASA
jgi:carboxyl-terminal processing protease